MSRGIILPGVAVLAVMTAALSATGLASLGTGTFGFSEAFDERGFALLSKSVSPETLAEAERLSEAALQVSPYGNPARLRLAYIESVRLGRLGPRGVKALQESYDLMPVDYSVAAWRIRFCLEHWSELTPETRAAVRYEALAFASVHWTDLNVRELLGSVQNPSGALAAAFILQEMR